jgi:diacylglycerol kinase family enzyme
MRHLFIVNPKARLLNGRTDEICREIRSFFLNYPEIDYYIHVTRWKRDAVGYTLRFVSGAAEIVRVYAVGGMGTLFEVINGVIGLPNVQITSWPFGVDNSFLHYFGKDRMERFYSLRNLVFSGAASFDVIRCGNNYGICAGYMGLEAIASRQGDLIIEHTEYFSEWLARNGIVYMATAVYHGLRKETGQQYQITLDGMTLSGKYISILIANQPYYANGLRPAPEAEPDDGILDIYVIRSVPPIRVLGLTLDYARGLYYKWPNYISHFRGKKLMVSSDTIMAICIDGELFYDTVIEYEAIHRAVDFVCPGIPGQSIPTAAPWPPVESLPPVGAL